MGLNGCKFSLIHNVETYFRSTHGAARREESKASAASASIDSTYKVSSRLFEFNPNPDFDRTKSPDPEEPDAIEPGSIPWVACVRLRVTRRLGLLSSISALDALGALGETMTLVCTCLLLPGPIIESGVNR